MLPVAILAGGLATRLRPLTERVPKALLRIAGRPVHLASARTADGARASTRVVLCVGHLGEQIQAAVGDGGTLGLSIDYSYDGRELLGTGGALKRALPLLGDAFFVLNGDSYLTLLFCRRFSRPSSARTPGVDDGPAQRQPLGQEQCSFQKRRTDRIRQTIPCARYGAYRLRSIRSFEGRFCGLRANQACSTWQTSAGIYRWAAGWRRSKCPDASTKSAHRRV